MLRRLLRPLPATALALALTPGAMPAQPPQPAAASPALAPRIASYRIDARLDPARHLVEGTLRLTWRNAQAAPADELWFHLYWNAWRNSRSTWMLEDAFRGRSDHGDKVREDDWSWMEVDSVRWLDGAGGAASDLTASQRYVSPDDDNPDDRTVLVVSLPRPVAPGETIEVEVAWRARVPRTFARTGYRGDYYFIAHWFPKLGVFAPEGWNCHQFHAATEFFSDYGVYDVSLSLPARFVVGATGREMEVRDNGDGSLTHRFYQEDVHDFAWTASPDYLVREARFAVAELPPVEMRLLLQPEHEGQAERHFAATRAALENYGRWFGPYPYGHVTIVDPAYGSGTGGMEYPTLFTAGSRLFNPSGGGSPEGVTVHEAGHQFWYGMVGNNEFEDAWLDEGLNTFSTARAYEATFGDRAYVKRYFSPPGTDLPGFLPLLFPDIKLTRDTYGNRLDGYRKAATADVPATPSFRYFPATASRITYDKTALWLATLERYLGWPTLRRILSTFFTRYRFDHPRPADFFAVANEVSGQDLTWFFDQVYRGSATFDYAVASVSSEPARVVGYVEEGAGAETRGLVLLSGEKVEGAAEGPYRTRVVVRREGDGVFPVDIRLVFADGSERRESWDGRDRWKLIVDEREAKLDFAVVDPDGVLLLDLDRTNNSRQRESGATLPALKWASRWLLWLQDFLATYSFFV